MFHLEYKISFELLEPDTLKHHNTRYPNIPSIILSHMATTFWRTCRKHDGMRPAKFRPNRSIARRVMVFPICSNMAAVRPFEFKKIISDHVTVIAALTCCCVPNFIEIGSRVRPPDAHNCRMFNAPLLGNGCCHGNQIVRDMSGIQWDVTTQVWS